MPGGAGVGSRVDHARLETPWVGGRSPAPFGRGRFAETALDPSTGQIFESGGPGTGLAWDAMQKEVAKFTTACWYDRAGEGWSDPGPYPRTSASMR